MIRIAVAAFAAFLLGSAAAAAPLWQQSQSGMSATEVRTLFPGAVAPAKPSTLASGASCQLSIPSYEIAGENYDACFYFLGGKLIQVTLRAQTPNRSRFETILELLRSKHGPEIGASEPRCTGGMMTRCNADWLLPTGTNISMLYRQVGKNEPLLNINYQTRMASEASKL